MVIVAIVIIVWFVKGMVVAYRCRQIAGKEEKKNTEPEITEIDEDFEAGDSDTNN